MILLKKIIGLDLLRFSMALLMVLYHIQGLINDSILNELIFNGFFGTSTFFILSGFILTHVYYQKIEEKKFSNTNFLLKRFSALYPIHIFTMSMAIITFFSLSIITKKSFPAELPIQALPSIQSNEVMEIYFIDIFRYIIESITLIQAWDYHFLFLNPAAWSVSALFFFYLTFHFFVKILKNQKNLKKILMAFWLFSLIPAIYFTYTQNFSSDIIGLMHRNPLLRLPEFIAGIIFYLICLNSKIYSKKYQIFCLFFAGFGFFLMHYLVKTAPQLWFYLSHNGLFLFPQLALIYCFLSISFNNHKITTLIERLGKASLSIYMLHLPLLSIYFILYKLIIASTQVSTISKIIETAKSIDQLDTISTLIFIILLIPISLYLQEKLFTPIQVKLSNKLIWIKTMLNHRET